VDYGKKRFFFRFSKRNAVVFAVTCLSDISHENISNSVFFSQCFTKNFNMPESVKKVKTKCFL
jgi:hypothetical protein